MHAHLDCATLDAAIVEELVVNACCQLEAQSTKKKSVAGERLKFLFGTELGSKSQREQPPKNGGNGKNNRRQSARTSGMEAGLEEEEPNLSVVAV